MIVISFLWLMQLFLMNEFYSALRKNDVAASADNITANIDKENLSELVSSLSYKNDISIIILNEDGEIVLSAYSRFSSISGFSENALRDSVKEASKNGGSFSDEIPFKEIRGNEKEESNVFSYKKAKSLISTFIISNSKGEKLGLIIDTTITPNSPVIQTTVLQLFIVSVSLVLLVVIFSFVFTKIVVKPMSSLTKAANDLAEGKDNVVFEGGGYKEAEELKDALNFASKEISALDSLRRELISNVSHDLKTPLTMIKGYAEMMRDIPQEMTKENLQTVVDETTLLSRLVDDMLDLSRLEDGRNELNLKELDIGSLTETIIERQQKLLSGGGFLIIFEKETSALVTADEIKLSQVIYNLLSNAVNYGGEDKTITVKLLKKGKNIRLEIIDTGEGIDVSSLPHIWDRYYKSQKPHKRATVGTGLGLSIVKSVMNSHPGGVYGVESSIGDGSMFYIELPALRFIKP